MCIGKQVPWLNGDQSWLLAVVETNGGWELEAREEYL